MTANARAVASPRVVNIYDLRSLARRRVPKIVFNYIDGGAEGELTLQENRRAFDAITFRPRQAVAVANADLRTRVLGIDLAMPVLLAPVGYCRIMHPGGEVVAARAAGKAGTAYILSTVSGHRLEDVKAASSGPVWFQLYLTGGRAAAEDAIQRAQEAGYSQLVVTIDTTVIGRREREVRDGMDQLLRGSIWSRIPFHAAVIRASTMVSPLFTRRRSPCYAQYRGAGQRTAASWRCAYRADARRFLLGRHEMDPRSLERLDRDQGSSYCARCSTFSGSWHRGYCGLESWRPPA
jgi:hypothetical protein